MICDGAAVHRIEPPAGLEAVMVVPGTPVRTAQAREALPAEVPLADAVDNVASVAKLVLGLATGDLDLVAAGLGDRLHQPYRAHLYPRSAELVRRAPELGALGATISGAGPTVLVWCQGAPTPSGSRRCSTQDARGWAEVLRVPVRARGRAGAGRRSAPASAVSRLAQRLELAAGVLEAEPLEQLVRDVEVVGRQVGAVVEDRERALGRLGVGDRLADRRVEQLVADSAGAASRRPRASGACACRRCSARSPAAAGPG